MNTKHTPGPWMVLADPEHVGKHPYHDCRFIATADAQWDEDFQTLEVGSIICTMKDIEDQGADARLIAAAPDLLEALQGIAHWWMNTTPEDADDDEMPGELFDKMNAAITKATGGAK